jgi:hypothetical protein
VHAKPATTANIGGGRQVRVELTIDVSRLALVEADGRWEGAIDLLVLCGDSKRNVVGTLDQKMTLSMNEVVYKKALENGIPYTAVVPVSGSATQLKAIVYEFASDRIGTVSVPVR